MVWVFEAATLWAFAGATLAVYLAPGPDMAHIATNAFARGTRGGLAAAAGVTTGVWCQALAAAFGLAAVFAAIPALIEIVRWLGVAYLIYLGVSLLRAPVAAGQADREPVRSVTWREARGIWLKGLGINLLNPKITVFFVSFLPQFVDPARGPVTTQLLALAIAFSLGAIAWTALQAVVFARLGAAIGDSPHARRWQQRVTGTAFLAFATMLAATSLRRA